MPKKSSKSKLKELKLTRSHEPYSNFARRMLAYAFFGVLAFSLSFIIFYRSKGYTFNRSGEVVKRGVALIDSKPVSSKIFIDGKEVSKTDAKLELEEGRHSIRLEADGYRTWQEDFSIKSEEVKWLYYPYLIPDELKLNNIKAGIQNKTYSELNPKGYLVSVQTDSQAKPAKLKFELLDLTKDSFQDAQKNLLVPEQIFPKNVDGSFGWVEFIEWSPNGDSVYLNYHLQDSTDLINLRIKAPQESTNLTRQLKSGIQEAHYGGDSELILLINGEVAKYNPKSLQKEDILIPQAGITGFKNFAEKKYVYTKPSNPSPDQAQTPDPKLKQAVYLQNDKDQPIKVLELQDFNPEKLDYRYLTNRREDYLAISNSDSKEFSVYKNIIDAKKQNPELSLEPIYLARFEQIQDPGIKINPAGSSQPGSYVIVQLDPGRVQLYSFEDEDGYDYNLYSPDAISAIKKEEDRAKLELEKVDWIDSERLQARAKDGKIYYFDYNGSYLNLIGTTKESLSYFIRSKDKSVFINAESDSTDIIQEIKFKQ